MLTNELTSIAKRIAKIDKLSLKVSPYPDTKSGTLETVVFRVLCERGGVNGQLFWLGDSGSPIGFKSMDEAKAFVNEVQKLRQVAKPLTDSYRLRVEMCGHPSNELHKGWVDFLVKDPSGHLNSIDIDVFVEYYLTENMLVGLDDRFKGYGVSSIYPYCEEFGGLVFDLYIDSTRIKQIKKVSRAYVSKGIEKANKLPKTPMRPFVLVSNSVHKPIVDIDVQCINKAGEIYTGCFIDDFDKSKERYWVRKLHQGYVETLDDCAPVAWRPLRKTKATGFLVNG